MAEIEYHIEVDANGNSTVTQDVRRIDPGDTIFYTTSGNNVTPGKKMAIRFVANSPHGPGPHPQPNAVFTLDPPPARPPHPVAQPNHNGVLARRTVPGCNQNFSQRKSFHFDCGEADPNGANFSTWAGGGGDAPSGGD
jgi:hypothetical protein